MKKVGKIFGNVFGKNFATKFLPFRQKYSPVAKLAPEQTVMEKAQREKNKKEIQPTVNIKNTSKA